MQPEDDTLTIVTAASSNHGRCLRNLLYSLDHHETAAIVVYDIGLTPRQVRALRAEGRHVVRFPFEQSPAFFGTQAQLGTPCCWKPVLIREVMEATGGPVLWLDAGNLVHERLERVRAELAATGFYSPASNGDIARYTHPQVLALLEAQPEILAETNRNGAIVGFGRNELALELSRQWRDCALRQEIMWPADWTKRHWRSDQAILSVLVAQARRRYGFALENGRLGISTHNDGLSRRSARLYMMHPPDRNMRHALLVRDRRLRAPAQRLMRALQGLQRTMRRLRRRPARRLWRMAKQTWRGIKAVMTRG